MKPPPGAPLRRFTLNYDVIVHEVVSHKSFVLVRNDWDDARFHPTDQVPPMPEAIGLIRYLVYSVIPGVGWRCVRAGGGIIACIGFGFLFGLL